jgi:uridine kinase
MTSNREALISQIQRSLHSLQQRQIVVLVAIDGPGGAGKSTLANELRGRLDAAVVAVDDFYRVMEESVRYSLTAEEGYMQYFDWQRLRDQVLAPLRCNEIARYARFDWQSRQLGSTAEVQPNGVVLVEGVGSFRPEFRSFYDYSVYVDGQAEVCRARLRSRGDSEDWISRWDAAQDWYVQHHDPRASVDVVVS